MGVVDDIEWAEQRISIQFYIKLEHSSAETIWMIQKAATMGNWWLADSPRQYAQSYIMSHSLLVKHQITQVTQTPLKPRFGTLWLLAFPKTKNTFEREEISDLWWDSGKYNGTADGDWENCVKSQGAYFEGDWGAFVLCTMFLVSSSINVSYFPQHMAGYFRTALI